MNDISIQEMMTMQMQLWEQNKEKWSPMAPEYGRNSLLWMIEEIGEVISIIKKKSETAIMEDSEVRGHFVEELADVYMYLTDTLLRYGVTAEEIAKAYTQKHEGNIQRNYSKEYAAYLK